jgi:hypothetical protein
MELRAIRLWAADELRRPFGSSSGHTLPRYYAAWSPEGMYLSVKRTGGVAPAKVPTTRGVVCGFSRKSRGRLLRQCAQVNRQALTNALFVTLTYPEKWPDDWSSWKRHLSLFWKRLIRVFPRLSAVWKLELQERGAPHFHCIVFGQRFIPHELVSRLWYEVAHDGDRFGGVAGTETRRVNSGRQALSYAAKYVAKVAEGWDHRQLGRIWGVLGRRHLPAGRVWWELDQRGYARLVRAIGHLASSRSRGAKFPDYPPQWVICDGRRAGRIVQWADPTLSG